MSKKVKLISLALGLSVIFGVANFALAQANFGLTEVGNGLSNSLTSTDPRIVIGRIIQIALSLLGAIAVVLVIYAGFLWMTSGGDEEKIGRAKKILKNAAIGLLIIVSSWAIVTFLLTKLTGAINGTGDIPGGGGFTNAGAGAIGACTVSAYYPTDNQKDVPRNTSIMVTFKEQIDLESVCVDSQGGTCACNQTGCNKINPLAIRVYKTELGDACKNNNCPKPNTNIADVLVAVPSGGKTLVLSPVDPLGSQTENTWYSVRLTNQLKKLDGTSMFAACNNNYAEWKFLVNTSFDLTPPQTVAGQIFPMPDNEEDSYKEVTAAVAAQGTITVNSCPQVYSPAEVLSIEPASAEVILDYHGSITTFKVTVPANDKAQLFDGNDNLLGVADFDDNGMAIFDGYFRFKASDHPVGSLWTVKLKPEQLADTLTVGSMIYTFATSSANNNIAVPSGACDKNAQAANIKAKLSGHEQINVASQNNLVTLTAKVAGVAGNNIALATNNSQALAIKPLSGGIDRQESTKIKDKKDRPMNSVIQINFNEAVNPVVVSGLASEVADYIRVVNANASSSPSGESCEEDADCRSYKCQADACVGNYLGGKFMISNGYKTVEFISDQECGMNGCGEKIYCLPANSHLSVELVAADLKACNSDDDCIAYNPFRTCSSTPLGHKTCQNAQNKNYPTAKLSELDGIVDAAINSLDGNRDIYADGPIDFYNDNLLPTQNTDRKDKYKWSFYINDKIALDPPQITFVNIPQGKTEVALADEVQINFNTLMMNSTLMTGSVLVQSGTSTFEHKLINLRSASLAPLGYWVLNQNLDVAPLDGEPDVTISKIFHTNFSQSVTYKAQVGSGVKDIYQNCYKPSVAPNCTATAEKPSCCFGVATSTLGTDGNCK